jgi:hypothetical protein
MAGRVAPRRQRGRPKLGGHHPLHPLSGPCHELLDDIADRASAFHDPGDGLDRLMETSDRSRQSLEPFSLLTRQLQQERLRIGCPIASRASAAALRGATP